MSLETIKLMSILNEISPEALSEGWDHSGIQISLGSKAISKILVSLDMTVDVVDEAMNCQVDLIVTHHPLIFREIDRIDSNNFTESLIIKLIQANINVYAMHTSFDKVKDGNNDRLAKILNLRDVSMLEPGKGENELGLGRVGHFMDIKTLDEAVSLVKESLDIHTPISCVGNPNALISRVAICTGSGGSMIAQSIKMGCHVLITGDVNYHDALLANEMGLSVIDAGHYHTEKIFVKNVADQLKTRLQNKVEIIEYQVDQNPFRMI